MHCKVKNGKQCPEDLVDCLCEGKEHTLMVDAVFNQECNGCDYHLAAQLTVIWIGQAVVPSLKMAPGPYKHGEKTGFEALRIWWTLEPVIPTGYVLQGTGFLDDAQGHEGMRDGAQ